MPRLFLFAALLLTTSLSAQTHLGLTAGYESVERTYVEFPRTGFDHTLDDLPLEYGLGVQLDYSLTEWLGLRAGLLYARKGYVQVYDWNVLDNRDPLIPIQSELRMHYLDVPLTAYYRVVTTERYSLAPSAGLIASFSLGASEVSEMGDGDIEETEFVNPNPEPTLFALRLGLINNLHLGDRMTLSAEPFVAFRGGVIQEEDVVEAGLVKGVMVSVLGRL